MPDADLDDAEVASDQQVAAGPQRPELDPEDPKAQLQAGVQKALLALPSRFMFRQTIEGIDATDLHSLSTFLGASIETEMVRSLNGLTAVWDPDNRWAGYTFERSAQSFPDVRLIRRQIDQADIALGVELKGWWMLAKEGRPNLRYQVAPAACTEYDLVCVVPWHLDNAVSGSAVAVTPWVESARYAADWRDYWWEHVRDAKGTDASVEYPVDAHPYPEKADRVTAKPAYDGGGNYGRLPRCRPLMDDFRLSTMETRILGIEARAWVAFLSLHTERKSRDQVVASLQRSLRNRQRGTAPGTAEAILDLLDQVRELLP